MVLANYYCVPSAKCIYNVPHCSKVLRTREEFVNTANLGAVDILAVRLWLDRKVVPLNLHAVQLHENAILQNFNTMYL